MAIVLLTDGQERASLAACRSLVADGHEVHVVTPVRDSLAGVSRGVTEHLVAEDALAAPRAFAAAVASVAERLGQGILIPISDQAVAAILASRDSMPRGWVLPFPGFEAFQRASDKVALLPLARQAGFSVPESVVIRARADIAAAQLEALLPGILKPHRSVVRIGNQQQRLFPQRADTLAEARRQLAALPDEAFPVLVQQRIEGPGVGYFALRWGDTIRAEFAHRRLREIPPTGGVSVYRESIAVDAALEASARRLLELLGWNGVAMVECKQQATTGQYYVIEVNARFWGSLQLAIDAGVDFPALLVACAQGRPPHRAPAYRSGIRSRWEWGEMDHIYLRAKLRQPGETWLGTVARGFLRLLGYVPGRDRAEVFRWGDPRPFLIESLRRLKLKR